MVSQQLRVTHILYLAEWPGRNAFSGAEEHVFTLLAGLAVAGVDVELVVMRWGGRRLGVVDRRLEELANVGVRTRIIAPDTTSRGLALRWSFVRAWGVLHRELVGRRDRVIHIHLDLKVVPIIAWLAGCRAVVLSIHNDEPVYRTLRWRIWLRVLKRLVTQFIAITEHVNAYFMTCAGVRRERITTIYYGLQPPTALSITRVELGVPEDAFVVGFVGRLTEQKNLFALVDAMVSCKDMHALIVGDGPLRAQLEAHARAHALDNITFAGAIPSAAGLIPLFDVFCLPSLWEGLGLVLVEAMLQGVPIVGSRCGAIPEVLGQGRYGLLAEPTSEGIASALREAKERIDASRQRAVAARDYAGRVFTTERMVSGTIAVYRDTERTAWSDMGFSGRAMRWASSFLRRRVT